MRDAVADAPMTSISDDATDRVCSRGFPPVAQLHPDKHRGASAEALESVASQFKEVSEAYDVLCDEERRASYDRLRAAAAGGPRSGLGPRTPEEVAAMMRGMREMARLRREGMRRSVKAPPLAAEVRVSLCKLHRGCTKSVRVVRRCVDPSGVLYDETKVRFPEQALHSSAIDLHKSNVLGMLTQRLRITRRRSMPSSAKAPRRAPPWCSRSRAAKRRSCFRAT